jgi:hypothetical protein
MDGWRCPGCGAYYAPFVERCGLCMPRAVALSTSCPGCGKTPCEGSTTGCPLPKPAVIRCSESGNDSDIFKAMAE